MTYFFSIKKVSNEIKITNDIKMIENIIIDWFIFKREYRNFKKHNKRV